MSSDHILTINKLIQQITINIAQNNFNGAIKDSQILNAIIKSESGNSKKTIVEKLASVSFFSVQNIETIINEPTDFICANTLKQNNGEDHLLNLHAHIGNERKFKRAIELFQSDLIRNKCLKLMACSNDMQYETSINLTRKVMQLPNETVFNEFLNKLCAFDYRDVSINHLMDIFLVQANQHEFIVAEWIREAWINSMITKMETEDELISFANFLFYHKISTELLHECCEKFCGFYNLIKMLIKNYINFVEHMESEHGYAIWYFKSENISTKIRFADFTRFIWLLASTELNFGKDFLLFLKENVSADLLNYIFTQYQ